MATSRLPDEVVDLGEHPTGTGEHPLAGRGEHELPAGAAQQPNPERVLERRERARDRGLREPELRGGTGEARGVDDRGQHPQVTQLDIHALSV